VEEASGKEESVTTPSGCSGGEGSVSSLISREEWGDFKKLKKINKTTKFKILPNFVNAFKHVWIFFTKISPPEMPFASSKYTLTSS